MIGLPLVQVTESGNQSATHWAVGFFSLSESPVQQVQVSVVFDAFPPGFPAARVDRFATHSRENHASVTKRTVQIAPRRSCVGSSGKEGRPLQLAVPGPWAGATVEAMGLKTALKLVTKVLPHGTLFAANPVPGSQIECPRIRAPGNIRHVLPTFQLSCFGGPGVLKELDGRIDLKAQFGLNKSRLLATVEKRLIKGTKEPLIGPDTKSLKIVTKSNHPFLVTDFPGLAEAFDLPTVGTGDVTIPQASRLDIKLPMRFASQQHLGQFRKVRLFFQAPIGLQADACILGMRVHAHGKHVHAVFHKIIEPILIGKRHALVPGVDMQWNFPG